MSERKRIIHGLAEEGVLSGIRWAYDSAARRTREDYDEPTGYDATWVGISRWKLLCDRLDRVFSCGKYATGEGSLDGVGLDVLFATLTKEEQAAFPHIASGVVVRDNVVGSPGWSNGDVRWLLASSKAGGIDKINWSRRSPLKQRTAKQMDPDSDQLSIFDALGEDEIASNLSDALVHAQKFDRTTLVVTHAQDIDTDARELFIGLPSMESSDRPWAWAENLLGTAPTGLVRTALPVVATDTAVDVPAAPVRLRTPEEKSQPRARRGSVPKQSGASAASADEGR